MCLSDVKVGECVTIKHVHVPGVLGERLMEMGLVPSTKILVVRRSYGLLSISVRGYALSIRGKLASDIIVE